MILGGRERRSGGSNDGSIPMCAAHTSQCRTMIFTPSNRSSHRIYPRIWGTPDSGFGNCGVLIRVSDVAWSMDLQRDRSKDPQIFFLPRAERTFTEYRNSHEELTKRDRERRKKRKEDRSVGIDGLIDSCSRTSRWCRAEAFRIGKGKRSFGDLVFPTSPHPIFSPLFHFFALDSVSLVHLSSQPFPTK